MQSDKKITRENALELIKQFAREYRKELGKVPSLVPPDYGLTTFDGRKEKRCKND